MHGTAIGAEIIVWQGHRHYTQVGCSSGIGIQPDQVFDRGLQIRRRDTRLQFYIIGDVPVGPVHITAKIVQVRKGNKNGVFGGEPSNGIAGWPFYDAGNPEVLLLPGKIGDGQVPANDIRRPKFCLALSSVITAVKGWSRAVRASPAAGTIHTSSARCCRPVAVPPENLSRHGRQ